MANPNIPSIELIPNQPFVFSPADPNCLGNDNRDYCVLVNECDQIQIQEKLLFNTDCFDNILCTNFIGPELVTDGDFSEGDTHWSEAGNNWVITSGVACYTAADDGGVLYQTISGLSEGTTYSIQFTISNYVSGTLTPFLWDTNGSAVGADGTYLQYITILPGHINETLLFDDTQWDGCITNIFIAEVGCWNPPGVDDWLFGTDTACHVVGSVVPIISTLIIPVAASPGCTFELIITISGMTSGSLTADINGDAFEPITANGVYSIYVTSLGDNFLSFTPSSDFDGCMSVPELRRYCDYPQLGLFDLDDNFILDLSNDGGVSIDVEGRHITWTFKLCQLEQVLAFGCYKFKLFDTCNDCFLNDNLLANSTFQSDLSGWTTAGGFAWNSGRAQTTNTGSLIQDIGDNDYRCVRITVFSITGGTPSIILRLSQNGGGAPTSDITITTAGVYSVFGFGGRVHFSVVGTGVVTVDDIYAITSAVGNPCDPHCYQIESNCLNWKETHECTKHIVAYCEENSLGFNFGSTLYVGTGFKLQERFRIANFNPTHNKDRNVQLDSGGAKKLVFAQNEKQWQLRFDYTDQIGHDTIAAMMDCDVIQINHGEIDAYPVPYDDTKEYVCLTEDYEPEWAERGERNLAQSQIEITEVPSTIFNQNLT